MHVLHSLCLLIKEFFVICPATYAEYRFRLLEVKPVPLTMQKPGSSSLSILCWKSLLERFSSRAAACLQHPGISTRPLACCFQSGEAGRSREIWSGGVTQNEHQLLLQEGCALPAALPLPWCAEAANQMHHKLPTATRLSHLQGTRESVGLRGAADGKKVRWV